MESYIKNLQMVDLFKVGGIFQCFFPKTKVAKFHFLKPLKSFPCLQEIARLQGSLVKTVDISRRIIAGKDSVLQSLNKELEKNQDEFRKENEKLMTKIMTKIRL